MMADAAICGAGGKTVDDGLPESSAPSSNGSPFPRKIKFHLARNPFAGFSNGGGDFWLETLNPNSETQRPGCGPGRSIAKKSDGSEVVESGLDPEISLGITFRRIGAGLENLGNTCFLNSVLQCLTYTEPLAAYLQSGKHQTSCHIAGFCALCAIQKHVSRALQSTGRILAPKDLVSNLRCISRNFRNARQEDAHEYMVNLLESMHKCCLPSGVPSESPSAYEKSLVHRIFGGRLRSQVKCMQCSYCSNKFDPFLDLSLEIVKADSLHKALVHFTATEQLDGGERQYQCQRCKQKVKALKQLTVHKAPYVLTIHLKRFASYDPGQKIDRKVHFGPTLDLKPFVSGSYDGDLKYTLYGVLVHAGWSTHSGHYYCFVRTSTGLWYSLDDNMVVQVSERTVLEQKAYMLFYVRERKNFTSKIPVDIQKGSLNMNGMGNKTHSSSNQSVKETIQNGQIAKRLNGVAVSVAVAQRDALSVNSSKETLHKDARVLAQRDLSTVGSSTEILLKEAPIQKIDSPAASVKTDPVLESSSKPPLLNTVKGLPEAKPDVEERFLSLPPCVKVSHETSNTVNQLVSMAGSKITGCDEDKNSKKDLGSSVASPPTCNGPHYSAIVKPVLERTSQEINIGSGDGDLKVVPSRNHDAEMVEKIDMVMSPKQPSRKPSQVECIKNGSDAVDSVSEKADHSVQGLVAVGSLESSIPLVTTSASLDLKSRRSVDYKKSRMKFVKCRVASMHLGSNILFGASLTLRKKKKHKKSKRRTMCSKDLIKENLFDGDCVSAGLGPSTSEKTKTISLHPTLSCKKGRQSRPKKGDKGTSKDGLKACGDSLAEIRNTDEEFRRGTSQNGAVLATDKQTSKCASSSLATNQRDAGEAESLGDSKRASIQNGLMNMLTRGLDERIVARWDGIELSPSTNMESSTMKGNSIGYILDEWDEEYDQGKRKKVRKSNSIFGGPNLFQEIAMKKAEIKKLKMHHTQSNWGNQPFRI
ncbi:ubiquitin carboxyl-terminal hydrolase 23 [Malania oleifera]|uniref:ubiquitin carboxyl-terminal hydrolase 23 n=1 Tax=Malania oleifera TaxID=397392 RepID=UPI0025AE359B|nr:ubiquitin carboxyl-terminal hydrolase 23 [Malania oleifera]